MKRNAFKNNIIKIPAIFSTILFSILINACIDDSEVVTNKFTIGKISVPVQKTYSGTSGKKVYIGHDLPVNMELTSEYPDEDVQVQFYLLNVDDTDAVDAGNAYVEDIRFYYCRQTDDTKISRVLQGTTSYGLVINIPVEQSEDNYTGDYKIGNYYVLANIDKYDGAEIDIYKVYKKFKDKIDPESTIIIASDYLSKPDLSVNDMNFTGTKDSPRDSVTFYDLDLSKLPGALYANLGKIYIKPPVISREFTGSVDVKSSSNDALNVPVIFFLESEDGTTVKIPLEIYDKSIEGYVDVYYLPILRKNTPETILVKLRIPDDTDAGYFSTYGTGDWDLPAWENEPDKSLNYPLFLLRYQMDQMTELSTETVTKGDRSYTQKNYSFKITAEVNYNGSVVESRFIIPNETNSIYVTTDYDTDGNQSTELNNTYKEDVTIAVAEIDVKPNEGTKFYPCSAIDADGDNDIDDDDCNLEHLQRKLVIWWGGIGASIGSKKLGANIDIYMGIMFSNYSLLSWGLGGAGYIGDIIPTLYISSGFGMFFTAESHPFESSKSFYEFLMYTHNLGTHAEWAAEGSLDVFAFKDSKTGFGEYDVESVITLDPPSIALDTEIAGLGVNIKITGGLLSILSGGLLPPMDFKPKTRISLVEDGSLKYDIGGTISSGLVVEVSASAFELASIGGTLDASLFDLDMYLQFHTKTFYNQAMYPGMVKGQIGIGGPVMDITGPQGALSLEVQFLGLKFKQPIISLQSFKFHLYDGAFSKSGNTNWTDVAKPNLINYEFKDLNTSDESD